MSFPHNNGQPFPGVPGGVPDLGALAQPQGQQVDMGALVKSIVLGSAGLQEKGPATIELMDGCVIDGREFDLLVMLGPGGLQILIATLIDDDDVPYSIPWHAVRDLRPRPDLKDWVARQKADQG